MIKEIQVQLLPAEAHDITNIRDAIFNYLSLKKTTYLEYEILKKSIDARGKQIKFIFKVRVYIDEMPLIKNQIFWQGEFVANKQEVHIIGAGPAGLFCALQCIVAGLKPVIYERGKNVRDRRRDLALLNQKGILNEESNYCYGEGGAGTYSDGKLYTRSNKRGNVQRILELFHFFGADDQILFDAHPHIGTNKLPHIIEGIRKEIIACGGEIHFKSKLTDLEVKNNRIISITINELDRIEVRQLVLATGHSANDIYELLHERGIQIERKPFAIGVRVEHPQVLIDQVQYHSEIKDPHLPPASYSLVEQINGRGVFSFCMCPGGIIAPAATKQNTVVVNGWSPSRRNNAYANSGIVVSVEEKDYTNNSPLVGLHYQSQVEQKAYEVGGGKLIAPAQRMVDFSKNRASSTLPACSYVPGVNSAKLSDVLPNEIYHCLAKSFEQFGKKMKGYYTNEAIVVATESRTSSPVRIPRDKETMQHLHIKNLYPCAEGAGYAGGIVSAAMDGMNVAESILRSMDNQVNE